MKNKWLLGMIPVALVAAYSGLSQSSAKAENPDHMRQLLITRNCPGCDLSGAILRELNLREANLQGANLSGATLQRTQLMRANLESADLSGAVLMAVDLTGANLRQANLSNAESVFACHEVRTFRDSDERCMYHKLALQIGSYAICRGEYEALLTAESAACLKGKPQAEALSNTYRYTSYTPLANDSDPTMGFLYNTLYSTNLQGADLRDANLAHAELAGVDFRYATLAWVNATATDFSYALLLNADLTGIQNAGPSLQWTTSQKVNQWIAEFQALTD